MSLWTRITISDDDASQTFEAVLLEETKAQLPTVPSPATALLMTRTSYAKGAPVEYALDYYRGDEFSLELHRSHSVLVAVTRLVSSRRACARRSCNATADVA